MMNVREMNGAKTPLLLTRKVLIPCLLFLPISGFTQSGSDSAGLLKIHMDLRTVISEGKRLRMGGASLGWEFGDKRDEVTVGYYWTGKRGRRDISKLNLMLPSVSAQENNIDTDVRFFSFAYWLTLRDWKRWKLAVPMEAGIGRVKYTEVVPAEYHWEPEIRRQKVYPSQAALYGEWKATRWIGTGAHVGYRHYFTSGQDLAANSLNGLYFRFRVLVYMQTFYDWRDFIFRKEPLPSPFYKKE